MSHLVNDPPPFASLQSKMSIITFFQDVVNSYYTKLYAVDQYNDEDFTRCFNIILPPTPKSANDLFHSGFQTNIFMVLTSFMRATCLSHFLLFDYFQILFRYQIFFR